MTLLKARGIVKKYDKLEVLKGIDLDVQENEIVAIVGKSGAGKTTLLQILGTLDEADKGSVLLDNIELSGVGKSQLNTIRSKHIGFVFQFHNLMAELTALENVCLPAWILKMDDKLAKDRATELLTSFGLGGRLHHLPSELSGGEQQRVAVARALINNPKIIFADEPSGNLDSANAEELHHFFLEIRNKYKCSFVIVTHNQQLASMADRIVTMQDGEIIE